MTGKTDCPECGAEWMDDQTCTDHFHLMLACEWEHQLYDLHHLLVLCFYLQHPCLYSLQALNHAKTMLVDFLENGISPQALRTKLNLTERDFAIQGTPESHGVYVHPIEWTMTAGDVVEAGVDNYYDSIRKWAEFILNDLRESKNLA